MMQEVAGAYRDEQTRRHEHLAALVLKQVHLRHTMLPCGGGGGACLVGQCTGPMHGSRGIHVLDSLAPALSTGVSGHEHALIGILLVTDAMGLIRQEKHERGDNAVI
jgi:hypothetical protein